MKFLALDSGSRKWGYALFEGKKVIKKGIIDIDDLERVLLEIKLAENPAFIVVGRRRGAIDKLRFLKDVEIITVSETDTTMEARNLYFSEFPPKGLIKLLPKGLRVPDRAVDDFAAIVIGRRFLNSPDGIYRILRESFLKAIKDYEELEKEPVFINSFPLECCEGSLNEGYVVEASFKGYKGRAFSSIRVRSFNVRLKDVVWKESTSLKDKVIFMAALNALYRYQGKVDVTIHCEYEDQIVCAERLISMIKSTWGKGKIYTGRINSKFLTSLSKGFDVKFLDSLEENGVLEDVSVFVLSGKNLFDRSLSRILNLGKPVICYGPTVVALSAILEDLQVYCPLGK
ncbi:MAG: hypothetical protein N3C62_04475 [Synergistetes bacterium]|nr:hypothetical protein [Synergistota bacterium]MCX8127969.1 hypothetical protein [Synergistota bacterium]MDW8192836.1 hypothetical protein [Synergistota bacterium]